MLKSEIKEELLYSLRHPHIRVHVVGSIALWLIVMVVWLAYLLPMTRTLDAVKANINRYQIEISNSEYRAKIGLVSENAARQVADIERRLDASVTQATLVQSIASLARKSNVKVISEAYEEGKIINGCLPLVHELTVQAGYAELRDFISGLQQLPILAVVEEADFSRSSTSPLIKGQLRVITYKRISEQKNEAQ